MTFDGKMVTPNTCILFSGHLKNSQMNCESVCLIIFSHSFTIAIGTAEIYSSVWETFQAVALNFRVSSIALMQIVNQQIPKEKAKEHHIIILYVIVLTF